MVASTCCCRHEEKRQRERLRFQYTWRWWTCWVMIWRENWYYMVRISIPTVVTADKHLSLKFMIIWCFVGCAKCPVFKKFAFTISYMGLDIIEFGPNWKRKLKWKKLSFSWVCQFGYQILGNSSIKRKVENNPKAQNLTGTTLFWRGQGRYSKAYSLR